LPRFGAAQLDADVRAFFVASVPRRSARWHPGRAVRRHHHRDVSAAGALSALYYADRLNQLPIG